MSTQRRLLVTAAGAVGVVVEVLVLPRPGTAAHQQLRSAGLLCTDLHRHKVKVGSLSTRAADSSTPWCSDAFKQEAGQDTIHWLIPCCGK